jgi:hypothetical protein
VSNLLVRWRSFGMRSRGLDIWYVVVRSDLSFNFEKGRGEGKKGGKYVSCRNALPRTAVDSLFDSRSGKYRVGWLYIGAEATRSRVAYCRVMLTPFIKSVESANPKVKVEFRAWRRECVMLFTR